MPEKSSFAADQIPGSGPTGTLTQHLTYGLREAGFEVVCMEARQVNAALSAMRNKTDKHDARGIAQTLRAGWYSRVHVKSVEAHHTRALLTSRKVMQGKATPTLTHPFFSRNGEASLRGGAGRGRD